MIVMSLCDTKVQERSPMTAYRTMVLVLAAEVGNTNEGLDMEFGDREFDTEPLIALADSVDWDQHPIVAVAVRPVSKREWVSMSAHEYQEVLSNRTDEATAKSFEVVEATLAEGMPTTNWHTGDYVGLILDDDTLAIGVLDAISGNIATVWEAESFNRVWGSSLASRGRLHHVPLTTLKPCPQAYRETMELHNFRRNQRVVG